MLATNFYFMKSNAILEIRVFGPVVSQPYTMMLMGLLRVMLTLSRLAVTSYLVWLSTKPDIVMHVVTLLCVSQQQLYRKRLLIICSHAGAPSIY